MLGIIEATPILRAIGPLLCYAMAALEIVTERNACCLECECCVSNEKEVHAE